MRECWESRIISALEGIALIIVASYSEIPSGLEFEPLAGVRFERPLWFGEMPGFPSRYLVLERGGTIQVIEPDSNGALKSSVFLRLKVRTQSELGLLGLAFHPDFAANRTYFVNYTPENGDPRTIVSRRRASSYFRTDSGEETVLLEIPQPFLNHNGGHIAFGPDGFLYIGMGDGGSGGDPRGNGQDRATLLGAILRIDVNQEGGNGMPYRIPPDNPFVNQNNARDEIWAYGLRNPWRFSFDALTGEFWYGDVGQNMYEEVGIARKGDNLGWNIMEGFSCFNASTFSSPLSSCDTSGLVPPIAALERSEAQSITGGYVYRADSLSPFYGVYIFGDFVSKRVWGLRQENGRLTEIREIGISPAQITSFATDLGGNLYLTGFDTGLIYRLKHSALGSSSIKRKRSARKSSAVPALHWYGGRGAMSQLKGKLESTRSIYHVNGRLNRQLSYFGKLSAHLDATAQVMLLIRGGEFR